MHRNINQQQWSAPWTATAAVLGAVLLVVVATGCGGAVGTAEPLPACGKPPSPSSETPPPGAILPDTTRMTAVRADPPVTQLNAYVEQSPQEVRAWVDADEGLEVLNASPDGREIELLVSDGTYTTWVSARAICDGASVLAEVIAPEGESAALPPVRGGTEP